MSGFKVNNSETRAVWIGSKKFGGDTFNHRYKLDWNQTDFTILGVRFSCNLENMIKIKQINLHTKYEHSSLNGS